MAENAFLASLVCGGHDVFISYASEDEKAVGEIVEFLEARGVRCWIDRKGLRFSRRYDEQIESAIRGSCVFLWFASKASITSEFVRFEIASALNHRIPVGPVYLEPMDLSRLPPPFDLKLPGLQGIEFFSGDAEENKRNLADELRRLIRPRWQRRAFVRVALAVAVVLVVLVVGLRGRRESPPPATPLPDRVAKLPAAGALNVAYGGSPPSGHVGTPSPRLQIDVLARRAGEKTFSPLKDGDALASEVDSYLVVLRPLTKGYLYVFQVDSVGKKDWLFPENPASPFSSGANPVEPGKVVQVPDAKTSRVLFLDRTTGVEHLYVVFSARRWPNLEKTLAPSAPPPAGHPGGPALALAVRSPNALRCRGVGGARVEASASDVAKAFLVKRVDGGQTWSLPVSPKPFHASGSFLVIERWFRHVNPE